MSVRLPAWTAKLAVRFFVVLGLLNVVFLGGAFLGLDTFLERLFRETAATESADLGRAIKSSLRQQMLRGQGPAMDATLADLAASQSVRSISIIDRNGRVAHSTDKRLAGQVLDRARDARCAACHSTPAAARSRTWFATDAARQPIIRYVETIENDAPCRQCHDPANRLNGIVVIERSTGVFRLALATIRERLAGTAALTMVALLATTLLFARRHVVRPVERLLEGARRFGAGDLDYRIAVNGRGEVADLGVAFNVMAADLDRNINEVRSKTAELTIVYSILERVTKSIHLTELQVVILQTFLEVLQTDVVLLAGRPHDDDGLELRWLRRGLARIQTVRVEPGHAALPPEVRADFVAAWQRGELAEPLVEPGGRAIALPIAGSRTRALLVLERRRAFLPTEANLTLLKVIAQHAAVAYDNAYLYTLAVTDPLTRLFTVRLFHERLDERLAAWQRDGKGFGLVMIDLDHFKRINDTRGHPAGDEVLKAVSRTIREVIRLTDTAYRYGGEEFCVLLPGADTAGAEGTAERLRAGIERAAVMLPDGSGLPVTASLGFAVCPNHGTNARGLLAEADDALYRAKRAGRNRVCSAGPV